MIDQLEPTNDPRPINEGPPPMPSQAMPQALKSTPQALKSMPKTLTTPRSTTKTEAEKRVIIQNIAKRPAGMTMLAAIAEQGIAESQYWKWKRQLITGPQQQRATITASKEKPAPAPVKKRVRSPGGHPTTVRYDDKIKVEAVHRYQARKQGESARTVAEEMGLPPHVVPSILAWAHHPNVLKQVKALTGGVPKVGKTNGHPSKVQVAVHTAAVKSDPAKKEKFQREIERLRAEVLRLSEDNTMMKMLLTLAEKRGYLAYTLPALSASVGWNRE